jgi:hypothetical protein
VIRSTLHISSHSHAKSSGYRSAAVTSSEAVKRALASLCERG